MNHLFASRDAATMQIGQGKSPLGTAAPCREMAPGARTTFPNLQVDCGRVAKGAELSTAAVAIGRRGSIIGNPQSPMIDPQAGHGAMVTGTRDRHLSATTIHDGPGMIEQTASEHRERQVGPDHRGRPGPCAIAQAALPAP